MQPRQTKRKADEIVVRLPKLPEALTENIVIGIGTLSLLGAMVSFGGYIHTHNTYEDEIRAAKQIETDLRSVRVKLKDRLRVNIFDTAEDKADPCFVGLRDNIRTISWNNSSLFRLRDNQDITGQMQQISGTIDKMDQFWITNCRSSVRFEDARIASRELIFEISKGISASEEISNKMESEERINNANKPDFLRTFFASLLSTITCFWMRIKKKDEE